MFTRSKLVTVMAARHNGRHTVATGPAYLLLIKEKCPSNARSTWWKRSHPRIYHNAVLFAALARSGDHPVQSPKARLHYRFRPATANTVVIAPPAPVNVTDAYQLQYLANLTVGDGVINITNASTARSAVVIARRSSRRPIMY